MKKELLNAVNPAEKRIAYTKRKCMKRVFMKGMACIAFMCMLWACSKNSNDNQNQKNMEATTVNNEPVMGLGNPVATNFTGEAWLNMLSTQPEYDCNVYNVTFAPGTRNDWHLHAIGQILLCTEGEGWYQEHRKEARRLRPGDVVNIPAHTMHWHGATSKSRFTHIGITPKVSENTAEWSDPVTDEEYNALPE